MLEHKNGTFTVLKSKPRIVVPSDVSADPVMHVSKDGTVSGTGEKQIDMTTIVAVAVRFACLGTGPRRKCSMAEPAHRFDG